MAVVYKGVIKLTADRGSVTFTPIAVCAKLNVVTLKKAMVIKKRFIIYLVNDYSVIGSLFTSSVGVTTSSVGVMTSSVGVTTSSVGGVLFFFLESL